MKSEIPKVLHPMCGRTLLGHAIFAARGLAPDHIAVVVRHERDRVAERAGRRTGERTVGRTRFDPRLVKR